MSDSVQTAPGSANAPLKHYLSDEPMGGGSGAQISNSNLENEASESENTDSGVRESLALARPRFPTDEMPTVISQRLPLATGALPGHSSSHPSSNSSRAPRGSRTAPGMSFEDMSESAARILNGRILPGERLGHFELLHYVGGGGMGKVFRALDTRLARHVALKILAPEQASDHETVLRFQNEAQSAARLDHENIARVHYVGEDRGLHFIAFEFIDGVNVRDLVESRGPLPLAEAVGYALQVADALAHASSRNVVHRDIKPSNLIITPLGQAKLIDMGLARLREGSHAAMDLTASGMTLGTFDYISPEQARDPRNADVRSDIYSLGCTWFFMFTGRPPFLGGTVLQKLLQHQTDQPPDVRQLRPDLPEEASRILRKMLAKEPKRRYNSAEELVSDLLALAQSVGITVAAPTGRTWMLPSQPSYPAYYRHLPWIVSLVSLLVIVATLNILWALPNPPPQGPTLDIDLPSGAAHGLAAPAATQGQTRQTSPVTAPLLPTGPINGATVAPGELGGSANLIDGAAPLDDSPATGAINSNSSSYDNSIPVPRSPASNTRTFDNISSSGSLLAVPKTSSENSSTSVPPSATNEPAAPAFKPLVDPLTGGALASGPTEFDSLHRLDDAGRFSIPDAWGAKSQAEISPENDPDHNPLNSGLLPALDPRHSGRPIGLVPSLSANPNPVAKESQPMADNMPSATSLVSGSTGGVSNAMATVISGPRAGVLVVCPKPTGTDQFATLKAACNAAVAGDVIELRYNGVTDEPPVKAAAGRLTIRAGDGFAPRLRFKPIETDAAAGSNAMIDIGSGRMTLIGLGLEMIVPRDVPAEAWSLIEIRGSQALRMEKCSLTISNASMQHDSYHRNVAFIRVRSAASGEHGSTAAMPAAVYNAETNTEIGLADCFARGEATLVRAEELQSVRVKWDNGLLVTTERLLSAGGGLRAIQANESIQLDLRHVTAIVRQGLVLTSTSHIEMRQLPIKVSSSDCIFAGSPESPLLEQWGDEPVNELRGRFSWTADRNVYAGFDAFWLLRRLDADAPLDVMRYEAWRNYWSDGRENLTRFGKVSWRRPLGNDHSPHECASTDFVLSGPGETSVNGESVENLGRGGASDGRDIGAIIDRLPGDIVEK